MITVTFKYGNPYEEQLTKVHVLDGTWEPNTPLDGHYKSDFNWVKYSDYLYFGRHTVERDIQVSVYINKKGVKR